MLCAINKLSKSLFLTGLLVVRLSGVINDEGPVARVKAHKGGISFIKCLQRGNRFITADSSGKITLWEGREGDNKIKKLASCKLPEGINSLAVSPNDRTLAISAADSIKTYTLPKLKFDKEAKIEAPPGLFAFSGDGRDLLAFADSHLYFFSANDMTLKSTAPVRGEISAIAFAPDNLKFVTGSESGGLTLWSGFSCKPINEVFLGEIPIALQYSSKGDYIISISEDFRIRNMRADTLEISPNVFALPGNTEYFEMVEKDKLVFIYCSDGTVEFMSPSKGIYAPESYQMAPGYSSMALFKKGKYILTGDSEGLLQLFRNPMIIKKYNIAIEKGDEAMEMEKYSLALAAYKAAMGLFPEKEAEEKLEQAQKGKEKMAEQRLQKIRKAREQWKR